ncbi:MAG: SusC/RagA family TonB-linked outer membrane protein [Sphingobacteriaceae bacterium]
MLSITQVLAQERTVTGTVTAQEDGLALPGVSVKVVGTQIGTQTGADGRFTLQVPENNASLVFTYIGYTSQTLAVATQSVVDIALVVDAKQLGEVVVTALGISKAERSIGYSVSTVAGDDLVKAGEVNAIEGLAAKASGVVVTSSSGTPGASTKIILRGPSSFSSDNQPLIVIDGVPMDNSVNNINAGDNPYNNTLGGPQTPNRALDINPEDIESVSILKGPAAAALYGQSAGNGAIIYTTKKGKARKGVGINYSSSVDFTNVSNLPKLQYQFGQGSGGAFSSATGNSWGEDLVAAGKPVYHNVENFFQTSNIFNNNLSLTGGNETTTFRMSFGSTNQTGVIPDSKLNRYSVRMTGDSKLTKSITVGGTLSYTNTNIQAPSNGSDLSGVMLPLLRMPAGFDGSKYYDQETKSQIQYFSAYDNPLFSAKYNPYNEENNRVIGNAYVDAKLNNIFSVSWKVGTDAYSTAGRKVYALTSAGNDDGDGSGQVNRTGIDFRNLYSDLLLKFKKSFGQENAFTINGLIGGNYTYSQFQTSFARGKQLTVNDYYNFNSAKNLFVSNAESYQNSKALFADATIDYKNIVFLTLTGRNEWSTTFGRDGKGFFYPKADVSYVFSHLLPNQNILSFGKVRFAYSNVGISPSPYNTGRVFAVPNIADGLTNGLNFPYLGTLPGFAISSTLLDAELKPERNTGLEAGLELKFLNNRISFDGTFYQQTSEDLLILQPIAASSGYQSYYHNIGKMRNRGVELSLNANVIEQSDFNWNLNVNWSKNVNTVLELAPGVTQLQLGSGFTDPSSYAIVGKPFGVLYGSKFSRDDAGNVLIDPANGLPITADELGDQGNPAPKWLAGLNNSFTYKSWSFSFLWDFRKGGTIWNGTWANLNFRGKSEASAARNETYVVPGVNASGPDAGKPNTKEISGFSYFSQYLGGSGATNELAFQDGSWARLRSIDLSYRFNIQKNNPKSALQYVELGANARNLILFTKYTGVDPETSLTGSGVDSGGSQNLSGYDYFNNPGTKSFIINLRVGF